MNVACCPMNSDKGPQWDGGICKFGSTVLNVAETKGHVWGKLLNKTK
jgi:hypothetical protein